MLKLAVIGKDVSQSQSPAMHTFLLHALGEECSYEAVSIPPENFGERAEGLFEAYDAFNVTIPFKTDIMPYLKELKGDAKTFGAVNVVLSESRTGYNTDGMGFLLMLENAGVSVQGKDVLVLGAGGAGRSCIKKLAEAGAPASKSLRKRARTSLPTSATKSASKRSRRSSAALFPFPRWRRGGTASSSTARASACTRRWA